MTTDFLDDERRRLAYADRAETRECRRCNPPCGQCPACRVEAAENAAELARPPAFVGSVDELEAALGKRFYRTCTWCKRMHFFNDDRDDITRCTNCNAEASPVALYVTPPLATGVTPSPLADGTGRHSRKAMEDATNGYSVSFTSVPQLCAAYEYALETLRRMYAITDRKQHAFQSEQDVMADARALLLAAGKDVE